MKFSQRKSFTPLSIFIDGPSKSGKAALGMLISSFQNVEHVKNKYIFDFLINCYKNNITNPELIVDQLIVEVDFGLFNSLMGRDLNTNLHDWSSVVNSVKYQEYLIRMNTKDNAGNAKLIFDKIEKYNIAALNTAEDVCLSSDLFLRAFGDNLRTITLLRHPIEIIYNWEETGRGTRFGKEKRLIHPTLDFNGNPIPLEAAEWSDDYLKSSSLERIVKTIAKIYDDYLNIYSTLNTKQFKLIFFDQLLKEPEQIISELELFLGINTTNFTQIVSARERIPRIENKHLLAMQSKFIDSNINEKTRSLFTETCLKYEQVSKSSINILELRKTYSEVMIPESINKYLNY
jgi:hypothetical protein